MATRFSITTQERQRLFTLPAYKGDEQGIELDFSPWASDNAAVSAVTWTVEFGQASIEGEGLDTETGIASARITTSEAGQSMIKVSVTDGTHTKIVYIRVVAKDPCAPVLASDYGMVRL